MMFQGEAKTVTGRSLVLIGTFLTLPATIVAADHHESYCRGCWQEPLVVVETKDCEGNAGLASFRAERVFKVESGHCRDPDESDKPLYQVMLRSLVGTGDYEIVWVDAAGMKEIQRQLEENRREALRRQDRNRPPGPSDDEG